MATLATIVDVESRLGRALTELEANRVEALLTDASALVVSHTGQQFVAGMSTNLLQVKNNKVRLSQRPATAVHSVTNFDGDDLPFEWDGHQVIFVNPMYAENYGRVFVTYSHGGDVPEDVIAIVAGLALRTFQVAPEAAAGVTQQTTGPFSVSYATWAVGGQIVLSPTDITVLNRYRTRLATSIDTLG